MFTQTTAFYDRLYAFKDYRAEVEWLLPVIRRRLRTNGNRLLDVACGTGQHLQYLKPHFQVSGLDLSAEMVTLARLRVPEGHFTVADMVDFALHQCFDVITCLFSSIGYVRSPERLEQAIASMTQHLKRGGILLIEPWFTPESWRPGTVHALLVDDPELKIARVSTSFQSDRISYFDFHYLIGTPQGTEHRVERHELGLFETEEMLEAMRKAGLDSVFDPQGPSGRGLCIGEQNRFSCAFDLEPL